MKRWQKASTAAATLIVFFLFIKTTPEVYEYVQSVKYGALTEAITVQAPLLNEAEERLLKQIEATAEKQKIAPIDAKIDRVWRAIPGLNGREIDIEKTFEYARINPDAAEISYQYKEIEPELQLEQLGAHPVYRGNPQKKMAAFMINVAWGNEYLDGMLATLKKHNVKATFFLDGSWLKKYPDAAKKIQTEGHELSNHAYSHPDMKHLSKAEQRKQIVKTEQLLKSTLQVENKWFAPPSGSYNQTTVQIAREEGLGTVLWTIDTIDWRNPPAEQIVAKIGNKLEPGSLILMHPTKSSSQALEGMIKTIQKQGYKLGTVSETLSSERVD